MGPGAGVLQSHGLDGGWDVPAILLRLQHVLGPAGLLSGRLVQNARWKRQTFTNVISLNYIHCHLRQNCKIAY